MKTLIFGAGFIGSAIHRHFLAQNLPTTLVPARDYVATGFDTTELGNAPLHLVICAGVTRLLANDLASLRANLDLVLGFLEQLPPQQLGALTFLSSIDVYGKDIDGRRLREDMPKVPQDYYSLGKCMLEDALQFFAESHGIRHMILRLTGIYGAGDEGKSMLSKMVSSACERGEVRVFAPGLDTRDYLHVSDVARLIEAFHNADCSPGVLNAATGSSNSILKIGQMVAEHTGARLELAPAPAGTARAGAIALATERWAQYFPALKPLPFAEGLHLYLKDHAASKALDTAASDGD